MDYGNHVESHPHNQATRNRKGPSSLAYGLLTNRECSGDILCATTL